MTSRIEYASDTSALSPTGSPPRPSASAAGRSRAITASTKRTASDASGWRGRAGGTPSSTAIIDEEDHVAMRLGGHTGASDVHGESWVSIAAFSRQLLSGRNDVGGFLVVGLALDRIATGPVHQLADPPRPPRMPIPRSQLPQSPLRLRAPACVAPARAGPSPPPPAPTVTTRLVGLVPPALARDCASAAANLRSRRRLSHRRPGLARAHERGSRDADAQRCA